jgi:multiple antibiotic resistance protein
MVGAGTISLTIILSHESSIKIGFFALFAVLSFNYTVILLLKLIKDSLKNKKFKIAFDKNMELSLRLFGFFLGAIGINMIITGIRNMFF